MLIAIDLLDAPASRLRPARPLNETDELVVSIAACGIRDPIQVTQRGNRYEIIDGLARLEAARLLGLTEVPVYVDDTLPEGQAPIAAAVLNMVRRPLTTTQQWRALAALQAEHGMAIEAAAGALGMDVRHARRLARLGGLAPEVFAVLERIEADPDNDGIPPAGDATIGAIASAPHDVQRAALAASRSDDDDDAYVDFEKMAARCRVRTISRARAIFDHTKAGVVFDEELFAEPGSADQFTTTDVEGFLEAQMAALQAEIDARRPKKRWAVGIWDKDGGSAIIGTYYRRVYDTISRPSLSGDQSVIATVCESGHRLGRVLYSVVEPKVSAKALPGVPLSATPAGDDDTDPRDDGDDDDGDKAADPTPAEPPARDPISKAGRAILAAAKTKALRDHLRMLAAKAPDAASPFPIDTLAVCLVLAVHARNVSVAGYDTTAGHYRGEDLIADLVLPGGIIEAPPADVLRTALCETLARMLFIDDPEAGKTYGRPSCGPVAEWVGANVGAHFDLPRFDTAEFLEHVNGTELKRLAIEHGIKAPGNVGELRKRLVGQLDKWQPAEFGAPAPKPIVGRKAA